MQTERTDRVNWSTLKAIGVSPKHYLHLLANPRPQTDALLLGSLTHCMVFEPDQINARYAKEPRFHHGMNDDTARAKGYDGGKQAALEWALDHTGQQHVSAEMYDAAYHMAQAVLKDPVAAPFVTEGWNEYTINWRDALTGIDCRGRVDHVNGTLSDLKTTRSLVSFERDIARFGYHAQLAWYLDGLHAANAQTTGQPVLVAVESQPPYDVLVLRFDDDDIAVGRRVYRQYLDRLAECRASGEWPGVGGGAVRRVVLPPWAGPMEDELVIDGETVAL